MHLAIGIINKLVKDTLCTYPFEYFELSPMNHHSVEFSQVKSSPFNPLLHIGHSSVRMIKIPITK